MEVYFDNASTTKPYDEVLDYAQQLNRDYYGNPSSAHSFGLKVEREIKKSVKTLAEALNVTSDEIIFTSGGTESNNLAIQGGLRAKRGRHIVTTRTEHPSVSRTIRFMEENGWKVTYVDVNNSGELDFDGLEACVGDDTALVSLIHVNNETGVMWDVSRIGEIVKRKNPESLVHIDGVQGFGKHPPNLKNIDLYSASAHKIHGPKGVGLLYVRNGLKLAPILFGGGQQRDIRPGTENTTGILSFCLAAELCRKNRDRDLETALGLKNRLLQQISDLENLHVNGDQTQCSPYILNISFPGIKSEVLLHALESSKIFVSAGSACNAKKKESGVLKSYGLGDDLADSALRFSFSYENTVEQVDYCAAELIKHISLLRKFRAR